MLLGAEIALLVLGIYTLITGKLVLTKTRVVRGTRARWLGAIGLLPLPLMIVTAVGLGTWLALSGRPVDPNSVRLPATIIEVLIIVACIGAIYGIGWNMAEPPEVQQVHQHPQTQQYAQPQPQQYAQPQAPQQPPVQPPPPPTA